MRTSMLGQARQIRQARQTRQAGRVLGLGVALATFFGAGAASATTVLEVGDNGSEQMGRGGAWVARASDPLAAFYNPAGLAGQETRLILQANINIQNTCFSRVKALNDGTTDGVAPGGAYPQVCNSGTPFPDPTIAFAYRVNPRLGLGFAILGPSAAGQETWPDGGPQRYLLVSANTLLLTPTLGVGWEPIDRLRVGASFIWGVASLDFTNDSWGVNTQGASVSPSSNDVKGELKVTQAFIPGFSLGTIWSPTDQIDVAGWYKFMSTIDAKGSANTLYKGTYTGDTTESNCGVPGGAQKCAPNDAEVKVPIPMEAKIGFRFHVPRAGVDMAHRRDPMSQDIFDIEADLTWANNSAFQNLAITFPPGIPVNGTGTGTLPPDAGVPHNFTDVWGARLGGDYNVLPDQLAVRAGAFFQTAAQPSQYQNIDFVGAQEVGIAAGGTYRIHLSKDKEKKNALELSVGIGHTFIASSTNNTQNGVQGLSGTPCNTAVVGNTPQGNTCSDGNKQYRTEWAVNLGTITNAFTSINVGLGYRF